MTDSSTPMDSTVTEAVARLEKVAEWYETDPCFPKKFEKGRQLIAADIRLLLAMRSASLPSGEETRAAAIASVICETASNYGEAFAVSEWAPEAAARIEALSQGEALQSKEQDDG